MSLGDTMPQKSRKMEQVLLSLPYHKLAYELCLLYAMQEEKRKLMQEKNLNIKRRFVIVL